MTKKRVKFGLAILGVLAIFLLALLALVFAPTGASAGKGPVFGQEQDDSGHSSHSNPAYFGAGSHNAPHDSNGGAVGPCAGTLCDTHDTAAPGGEAWHYADGPGAQGGPGANPGGGHSPNTDSADQGGNGYPPSLFVGGYPGGGGYGGPQGGSSSCASQKNKDEDSKDKESGDKTCDSGDDKNASNSNDNSNNNSNNGGNSGNNNGGNDASSHETVVLNSDNPNSNDHSSDDTPGNPSNNLLDNDPPPGDDTDEDLPPVDPNCFPFTEGCHSHDPNPPNTDLTDPPTEVPEPLTLSLFAVGLTGAAALRRRSRQKNRQD